MKVLGLIPARGGSKGVPRKNIRELCGKPLIQYTIDAALAAEKLDEVMVSTEDEEIAAIAKNLGAAVPFLRPEELASDDSPTIDAVVHVLHSYQKLGKFFDAVCLLQPTNPLRTSLLIDSCIEKFEITKADSLLSVRSVPHEFNPHWIYEVSESNFLKLATGETEIIPRRQQLPPAYYRDGSIYITKASVILEQHSLYGAKISYFNVDHLDHVNIDTEQDWKKAEKNIKD